MENQPSRRYTRQTTTRPDESSTQCQVRPPKDRLIFPYFINCSFYSIIEVPNFEYRKVQLSGVWDHTRSILLGPRTYENVKGYQVITPLVRFDGGSTVLVNRGFVSSEALKSPDILAKEAGPVQFVGFLRTSQAQNTFTPDNRPENGEWYWVDVAAMAEYAGGEARGVQPVYIEAIFGE